MNARLRDLEAPVCVTNVEKVDETFHARFSAKGRGYLYRILNRRGPAVLEKLRASDATKNIPVCFLTGVTESKKIKEALIMKPQSYLLKPINRERLMDTIEKLIG